MEFKPTKQYGNIKTVSASPEEDVTVIGFPNRLNLNSNKPETLRAVVVLFLANGTRASNYNVAYSNNFAWNEWVVFSTNKVSWLLSTH